MTTKTANLSKNAAHRSAAMTESRMMIAARALEKAGSVAALAEAVDVSRNAIYSWCDFQFGPSREVLELLQEYLNEQSPVVPAAPVEQVEAPKIESPRPTAHRGYNIPVDLEVHSVIVERHAFAKTGMRIIFASTLETSERVFVPPHTTEKLLNKLGGIAPIGVVFKAQLSRDVSGRSDFVAQELA